MVDDGDLQYTRGRAIHYTNLLGKKTLRESEEEKQQDQGTANAREGPHGRDSRVEPMHSALDLRARRAQLKTDPTLIYACLQSLHIPHT
jgi:hypothetical protein